MNEISTRAEIVTRRTYCRTKEDGTKEEWFEVVDRVIKQQRFQWERALTHNILPGMPLHDITEDMDEWVNLSPEQQEELDDLWHLIFSRKVATSGRSLWMSNTDKVKEFEASLFNCSFTNVETIYDIVDILHLLMMGCGVGFKPIPGALTGFRKPIKEIEVIRSTRKDKGRETNEESFMDGVWYISIGDSSLAWSKAIGKIIAGNYKAEKLVLDFSEIRPAGEVLKGFGWISSGDNSISKAFPKICDIMNKKAGNLLSKIDIIDIVNLLGTILSSRRSAEIALVEYGDSEWNEFVSMKDNCYTEEFSHRQQSNNSLLFKTKPTKEQLGEIFDMMIESGGSEPGIINMEMAKQRAPWFQGGNPCNEIALPNKGFCCLVEINLSKFVGNPSGLHKAATLVGRANYRATLVDFLADPILQESWHTNHVFLRLLGVGLTGIASRPEMTEFDYRNIRYSAITSARNMAEELGLEWPKAVTCLKPSGTLSKIMDAGGEGIHTPIGKYILNNINFSRHDSIVDKLLEAGYTVFDNPTDDQNVLVSLPIKYDNVPFTKVSRSKENGDIEVIEINDESAITQLERYKMVMLNYVDHNASITVYYSKEERDGIVDWIYKEWDTCYYGVSFLPRLDATVTAKDLNYLYLPQEVITKEAYDSYMEGLKEIDWSNDSGEETDEVIDDLVSCEGGACPIR